MSNLNQKLATRVEENSLTKPQKTIQDLIKSMEGEIARALPAHIKPDRIARIALTALRQNPDLERCTPQSFLAGLITSSQLGLEINTPLGQAYLIPYDNSRCIDGKWVKVKEAQLQVGYQGIIDLAYRTDMYQSIYAHSVDKADKFEMEYGLEKKLRHIPSDEPTGEVKGYYAVYRLKNGGYDYAYLSMKQVCDWRDKYSKAKSDKSPWVTNFDQMAKKTVLKLALKYAPKSIELSKQLTQDETVKESIVSDMYESPNVINYDVEYTVEPQEETSEEPQEQNTPDDVKKNSDPVKTAADELETSVNEYIDQKKKEAQEEERKRVEAIKAKIKEETSDEAKAARAAEYKKQQEKKQTGAEDILNRDPMEEAIKAQKEIDCKRIHIQISELNKVLKPLNDEYTDERYRKELDTMFDVKSSKDLTHEQAESFIKYLKDFKEAAKNKPVKQVDQFDEKELTQEAQALFGNSGKKYKDFVGDARKDMLRRSYENGKPLSEKEFKEIGIDPKTVPPEMIRQEPFEEQVSLLDKPPFLNKQNWEE